MLTDTAILGIFIKQAKVSHIKVIKMLFKSFFIDIVIFL